MSSKHSSFSRLSEEIIWLESQRGINHSQSQLKQWLMEDFSLSGFPHSVHIAGTNGKGSVIVWLELLLAAKGLSTASFISPHLIHHNERIRFDRSIIPLEQWAKVFHQLKPSFENRLMTMFEMDLWMSIAAFLKQPADWILVETGLGGTHDATTALHYPYGIITRIGLDHMGFLGETLAEIAQAKAGIIQPGMTVVSTPQDREVMVILQQRAEAVNAILIWTPAIEKSVFWPAFLPAYQQENFQAARTLLEKAGLSFTQEEVEKVLSQFSWPARFQILRKDPLIVLDGAHNLNGIQALVQSIQSQNLAIGSIFFSVLEDKQGQQMIELLQALTPDITLVHFGSYREADLPGLARNNHLPVISFEEMLKKLKSSSGSTLICGSLYFAGDVLKAFGE